MNKLVVLLSGPQGSGKSTLAKMIRDEANDRGLDGGIIRFAEPLYAASEHIQTTTLWYLERREAEKCSNFLVDLGDAFRKEFGEDILIRSVLIELEQLATTPSHPEILVVEDCRLPLEFDAVKKACREQGLPLLTIYLNAPEEVRKARTDGFRSNTAHKTESSLVTMRAFDRILDTSAHLEDSAAMAHEIVAKVATGSEKAEFERLVSNFNTSFRMIERTKRASANFKWIYDKHGKKCLAVEDVAPLSSPSPEAIAQAQAEVPDIMKKAESLLGVPEVASGD